MLAPVSVEEDVRRWNEETAADIQEIRRVYSQSGLYRNDGSTVPLWTVDWYTYGVEIASDGVHLIRHGPWASSTEQEAVSFFANGKLLKTYQIRELVDNPALLQHTFSHFFWLEDGRFDDDRLEYTLRTKDGNQFVFDVRTGEIVSKSRPARSFLWSTSAVVGASAAGILAWLVVRRWRRVQSRSAAEPSR